jgi:hypothetical protein
MLYPAVRVTPPSARVMRIINKINRRPKARLVLPDHDINALHTENFSAGFTLIKQAGNNRITMMLVKGRAVFIIDRTDLPSRIDQQVTGHL